ncbi:MAG: DUF4446 family protein [Nocardiopsaceae bacterium]|nr:DUF4446 family protein [Nocardiopsaceae bacterium]
MTTILAIIGMLAGLGGLALSGYVLLQARTAADECRALIYRLLPENSGVDVRAVRDIAVVHYDALEEMSGARSFSLAMLNAGGDGVVVTSINGRTESRTYAKTIEGGQTAEECSPEEYRAIRAARLGQGPGDTVPTGEEPERVSAPVDTPEQVDADESRPAVKTLDGESGGSGTHLQEVSETSK